MKKASTFKIISFNIGGYFSSRGSDFEWQKRAPVVAAIIKKYAPDIIGFQEVQTGNFPQLIKILGGFDFYMGVKTCSPDDKSETAYNPIFWQSNKFEVSVSGGFYISETPEKWSKSWGSKQVRGVNWVKFRSLENGREFFHFNTHLDHKSENARIEGSKKIVERISRRGNSEKLPVVLTGDFNSRAWSPENEDIFQYKFPVNPAALPPATTVYNIYIRYGFRDTFLTTDNQNHLATNTYHDCFGDRFPPTALRIDWILYLDDENELAVTYFDIIRDASPPLYASDHYPIIATFEFETKV